VISADEIIVLKDGGIAERGTHGDLLQRDDGLYASMWNRQREAVRGRGAPEAGARGRRARRRRAPPHA
jgi:ABC-type transport system involved in cytochrome bd biosynthesis fused ATPase/permease subunit